MRKKTKMDALIFIDTNIYLDFYRARDKNFEKAMLDHIDKHHEQLITTDQVYMEYKKNRQKIILESLKKVKPPEWNVFSVPAFLSDATPAKIIEKKKTELQTQIKKLETRVDQVLTDPIQKDPVYQCMQRLFRDKERHWHLGRENNRRFSIRRLAWKRFYLGYPPRKDKDLSIGDSINWEWIIKCAEESKKEIIIVSRDADYGINYNKKMMLNDWLAQEFKERISMQRKIILVNKLSTAFKMINFPVSERVEKQEDQMLTSLKDEPLLPE